ncbi:MULTISPECIES: formyltransferase [Methylobacterium]|uniref:Formyltransferase/hydrolase complex Fhc subunit B n=1 Tax=Methylobacterium thuringiense TaxID=1003091 RepID=A0ABQ4TGA6_9HYPH|nr:MULTISPECIES: formyltransferase [Methylobacterium]TXN22576.1 formyltransferase [Methylobacterium sp. WL9]GJE54056.1 Formyltransferase/hydrolase complex Fhc subunit B [Methylobacterium thuringiense]
MAAWVKGDAADTDAAVAAAAALLSAARTPVFAGLCADVAAVRAAYRLADRIGASLDPAAGPGLYAELGSLSSGGALTTTAPETLGRADTVLVVGSRPWDGDLVSEIADSKPVRGLSAGEERVVLSLGGPRNGTSRHVAYGIGNAGLDVAIGHLRAFVRGHLAGEEAYGDLATRLAAAKFGVVIYDAGEIGEAGTEMLQGLLKDLNEKTRFFALGLADPFQGRAVMQLASWTTGQAPRVGFGRHLPEHDPWRFDSARLVAEGEADAALWLASLPAPRPDWLTQLPSIAIVGEDSPEARPDTAEIVITVGVPGSSAGGAVWNDRRGVIGYVPATSGTVAATAAGVIAEISKKIAEKGASC